MSIERELLIKIKEDMKGLKFTPDFIDEIDRLLAQPEQEPVAWITEGVHRYRRGDTPIIDRAVSFTKGGAPAVPNPKYIPLYTTPPRREPLSEEWIKNNRHFIHQDVSFTELVRGIEKAHGIGGEE